MVSPTASSAAAPAMPERYLCPITTEIMVDPVMDHHGHNFERSAIAEWLGRSAECPLSREHIHLEALYPNLALKEEIAEWLACSHPMFGMDDTNSSASSTPPASPLADPPRPAAEPDAIAADSSADLPWERMAVDRDYYDRLLALFLSSGCEKGDRTALEDLCRFMNFVEAMAHLEELLPGEATPSVAFDDFLAFVQKYPPRPVLEYGMSQEEYADVLEKFQALDVSNAGKVSREAVLALAEDPSLGCSPAALLDALPEGPVTLHDVLGCVKRCRLLVARRRSVLTPATQPLMGRPRAPLRPTPTLMVKSRSSVSRTARPVGLEGLGSPTGRGSPAPGSGSPQAAGRRLATPIPGWPAAAPRSPHSLPADSPKAAGPHSPTSPTPALLRVSPARAWPATRKSDGSVGSARSDSRGAVSARSDSRGAVSARSDSRGAASARSDSPLPIGNSFQFGTEPPQPIVATRAEGRQVKPLTPVAVQAHPTLRRSTSQTLAPRSGSKAGPAPRCEPRAEDAMPPRVRSVIVTDRYRP
eukprot:EG_transcript_6455